MTLAPKKCPNVHDGKRIHNGTESPQANFKSYIVLTYIKTK